MLLMLMCARYVQIFAIITALTLVAQPAQGKDMNGKAGVGYSQTLGGVSGVSFRYWATKRFGIETILGASLVDRADLQSSTAIKTALGVMYSFAQHRDVNLSIALRLDIGFRDSPTESQSSQRVAEGIDKEKPSKTAEASEATFHFNLELPLIVEYFFSDNFSVNLAVGLVFVFVPDAGAILETQGPGATVTRDELGIGVGAGGLLGSGGFTFYF